MTQSHIISALSIQKITGHSDELQLAIQLAQEAMRIIHSFSELHTEWKSDGTPVTQVDKAINRYVIDHIRQKFPEHAVHGEEESFDINSEYTWICDPIDGTIPFSLALPFYSFSLALAYRGEPIIGVIAIPKENMILYAEQGKGAYSNGKRIRVREGKEIGHDSYIFTENWGGSKYDTTTLIQTLTHGGYNAKVFGLLSIVYAGAQVALGKADAVIFPGTTAHDVAALAIIIKEAGGIVGDIFGDIQKYDVEVDGFLGSSSAIQPKILKIIQQTLILKK